MRGALGTGAALVCSGAPLLPVGTAPAEPQVPQQDWAALRKEVQGRVLLPGEADYAAAKRLFDTRFDAALPAAVVQAATTDDVQAALAFAAANGLATTARGGGHSYTGASAADGTVVVDLRKLDDIRYDPAPGPDAPTGHVTVGAGATTFAVQDRLTPFAQTVPLGTCPTVGVAGSALGGGIGVESRAYGLTCDRLSAATLVRTDGRLVDISATHEPDLFWALRGGGGGQVGIVTSLTFRTCPATAKDIVRLTFPSGSAARVLTGWAEWLRTADRSAWAKAEFAVRDGDVTTDVLLVCPAGTGAANITAITASASATPVSVDSHTLGQRDAALLLAGGTTDPGHTAFVAGSDVLIDLTPEIADAIVEILTARARSGATGGLLVDPLNGAVGDIPFDYTVFPWRDHIALLQWFVSEPADPAEAARWIAAAHERLGAHSVGGYVNYLEPTDSPRRYFKDNLDRLRRIRAGTDPGNRLHSSPALW
ncbi:FAD-binding oxidoreductase [Nocardia arthritidis]|uniref:FAD-binding protein n=1 Tax=Nocardia arthritidis TaxID=228602 RepID=A0A6G9Y7F7_9NOCA|nr:FAD-binding oxidoreductase [Nocardia arthritidis]QIS09139.1 FAD-binding protein [Nocardia arthritidis]